ncbi:MAG: hypothetical protein JXR63_04825 [Spirochaetales bacterium]|nr:hypothetical protein [Spirochaetales bacterium]
MSSLKTRREKVIYSISLIVVVIFFLFLIYAGAFSSVAPVQTYTEDWYIVGSYSEQPILNGKLHRLYAKSLDEFGVDTKRRASYFFEREPDEVGKTLYSFTGICINPKDFAKVEEHLEDLGLSFFFVPKNKALSVVSRYNSSFSLFMAVMKSYPVLRNEISAGNLRVNDYLEIYCNYEDSFKIYVFVSN